MKKNKLILLEEFLFAILLAYSIYELINIIDMWKNFSKATEVLQDSMRRACIWQTVNWFIISFLLGSLAYTVSHIAKEKELTQEIFEVLYKKGMFDEIKIKLKNNLSEEVNTKEKIINENKDIMCSKNSPGDDKCLKCKDKEEKNARDSEEN